MSRRACRNAKGRNKIHLHHRSDISAVLMKSWRMAFAAPFVAHRWNQMREVLYSEPHRYITASLNLRPENNQTGFLKQKPRKTNVPGSVEGVKNKSKALKHYCAVYCNSAPRASILAFRQTSSILVGQVCFWISMGSASSLPPIVLKPWLWPVLLPLSPNK